MSLRLFAGIRAGDPRNVLVPHPSPRQRCAGSVGIVGAARRGERAVALVLALFIVVLASVLVVTMTYSTHLGSRLGAMAERSFEAEYLLKSAVNLARVLIKEDKTSEDSLQDLWGEFSGGVVVPPDILGVTTPNLTVSLEIRPEESKIPLRALVPTSDTADPKWRDLLLRLFRRLGFDEDNEEDHTGLFPGRVFTAAELVAALIDYMDADSESYSPEDDFASGCEGDLPPNTFANQRVARVGELSTIPGFTPMRLRKLSPFITVFSVSNKINVNLAPRLILEVLHPDIGTDQIDRIIEYRQGKEGPFTEQSFGSVLSEMIGSPWNAVSSMLTMRGNWFQVLAKVDYGNSTYFMRAYLSKSSPGELPEIRSVELF